jgi:plastocyanin
VKGPSLLALVLCAACGGGAGAPTAPPAPPPAEPPPPAAGDVTVSIGDNLFNPNSATILAGRAVRWVNNGTAIHNASAAGNAWNSGNLSPGESFERTFPQAGSFSYSCTLHPGMTGTVTVR